MTGKRYHASTDPVSLLADPVVRPDRDLLRTVHLGVEAGTEGDRAFAVDAATGGEAVVDPAAVHRARVRALSARVEHLEERLERAERRRLSTIDRYEHLLERRTERFRSWVAADDPRPGEFEWIGRDVETGDAHRTAPDAAGATAVATDGGRVTTGDEGIVDRVVGRLRSLID